MKMKNNLIIKLMTSVISMTAVVAYAAVPDNDSGYRDNPASNPSGQAAIVKAPFVSGDDDGTLYRREANGTENKLTGVGDSPVAGNPTTGIGANPAINDNGVIAAKISLTTKNLDGSSSEDVYEDGAIVTGTPGNVTVIAKTLDTRDGQVVCDIEPFPQINSNNEVFYGATTQVADDFCAEDGGESLVSGAGGYPWASKRATSRKAIYRYDPDTGDNDLMLLAGMPIDGNTADVDTDPNQFDPAAETVTTSDTNFVRVPDDYTLGDLPVTFSVIDAHLIAHGGRSVTANGNALATAWFTDDPTVTSARTRDRRRGFLYLTDSGPELVSMADRDDTQDITGGTRFSFHDKAYADNSGTVYFKTETDNNTSDIDDQAWLNRWTSAGGVSATPLLTTDDQPTGSTLYVNGYAPHMGFNDSGIVAVMAGLTDGADGNTLTAECSRNSLSRVDYCQGIVRISNNGSTKSLVARTSKSVIVDAGGSVAAYHEVTPGDCAADPADRSTNDTDDCFRFDSLGSVAMVTDSGSVIFVAYDSLIDDNESDGSYGYDNRNLTNTRDRSGIFKWSTDGSITRLIAEGDTIDAVPSGSGTVSVNQQADSLLAQAMQTSLDWIIEPANAQLLSPKVMRIYTPMPELRQMTASNGAMSLRVWLDTTGDDVADTDAMVQISGEVAERTVRSGGGGSLEMIMLVLMMLLTLMKSTGVRSNCQHKTEKS